MRRLEYPYHLAAMLVRHGVDAVNELVSKTTAIHSAYLDALYINGTLEKRVHELEQENRFLLQEVNRMTEEYEN
jgi:hypothetical protein